MRSYSAASASAWASLARWRRSLVDLGALLVTVCEGVLIQELDTADGGVWKPLVSAMYQTSLNIWTLM